MARHRNRSVFSSGPTTSFGGRILQIALLLLVVISVVGALVLGFGDFQPEPTVTEKPVRLQPIE
ncbi:MAG: hypothetical protein AAGF58_03650 [Pseudomonadota bacterium]